MIVLHNISVNYGKTPVLKDINIEINKGDFTYIVGPSGAGKTTLLKTIYLENKPAKGFVELEHYNSGTIKRRQIPLLRRKLGIVFQDFKLLTDRTIEDNIAFALRSVGMPAKKIKKRVIKVLTSVGIFDKRDKLPSMLSGGELQRACIARAIANDPIAILADEPTGNLDPATSKEIFKLLKKINKLGTAVLIATHNYRIIKDFPGDILYIKDGKFMRKI